MIKPNITTIVKILGFAFTAAGTLATGWATKRETNSTLAKLVEEKLKHH